MAKRKSLVVLTGAGISAESGIATFRGSNGLWGGHDVTEVASPSGWARNPELVLEFYNQRRRQAVTCQPNAGHRALTDLEEHFDVRIVTQNVDDLHERAGSSRVLHLHGELLYARSTADPSRRYYLEGGKDIVLGDRCELGSQLRPDIVWFGESVPLFPEAVRLAQKAEIFVIAGTSLVVHPAASLIDYVPDGVPVFIIDPVEPDVFDRPNLEFVVKNATEGLPQLRDRLIAAYR